VSSPLDSSMHFRLYSRAACCIYHINDFRGKSSAILQ